MCLDFFRKLRIRNQLKNTEVDAKGVCLAVYCAKIYFNCLEDDKIIYQYETDLKNMYRQMCKDNPYYDYDERQEMAFDYLSIAIRCSNGEYVKQRICEELENVEL